MQKLYVYEGKIDEIGDTITCNKYELEQTLILFSRRGALKVDVTG
ncbi:MAG: hypothetical protein WDZ91_08090 [Paenibacillaceae bacterium]